MAKRTLSLWLKFKVKDTVYAVDCNYVKYIGVVPVDDVIATTNKNPFVTGIFKFNNEIITLLSLRKAFNLRSLSEELDEFVSMIETRKKEHEVWVETLRNCIEKKEKFMLTTDPHKCNFGKWYYSYKSEHSFINFQLQKLEEPHEELHEVAEGINDFIDKDDEQSQEKLKKIMKQASEEFMPEVIDILEDTKNVYRNTMRELFVHLDEKGSSIAFTIDEVIGTEDINIIYDSAAVEASNLPEFVAGVAKDKNDELVMLVDVFKIIEIASQTTN